MATFFGTSGSDTMTGTSASDQFYGGAGHDSISTGGGFDVVNGGDGNDTINLVAGDSANGDGGADLFKISAGSNSGLNNGYITVNGGNAGVDADALDVGVLLAEGWTIASNVITSSDGQASIFVTGEEGYNGHMTLTKAGFTPITIVYTDIERFLTVASIAGPVDGTAGADSMGIGYSDAQGDQIDGNDGINDTIFGGAGNDSINAGLGSDTVDGGTGDDLINGNAGNDVLSGGTGNDTIFGGDLVAASGTPVGFNYIVNGSFEAGSAGWTGSGIEAGLTENSYFGNGSTNTVAEIDEIACQTTVMQQSFDVQGAQTAEVSFRGVLRNDPRALIGCDGYRVEVLNGAGAVISCLDVLPQSKTTWANYTFSVNFPTTGTYTLRFTELGNNDSLGALVDDVKVIVTSGTVQIAAGSDDILNGGDGNDALYGGGGNDTLEGGTGNDLIHADGVNSTTAATYSSLVTLTNVDNLQDSCATEAGNSRAVELVRLANGKLIMISSEQDTWTDGISSYQIDSNPNSATFGQIINPTGGTATATTGGGTTDLSAKISSLTESGNGAGFDRIQALEGITLSNGNTFVYSADVSQCTIGVASVNANGVLTEGASVTSAVLNNVYDISTTTVGGNAFLIAIAGGTSDSLISYAINQTTGALTHIDRELDGSGTGENYLAGETGQVTGFVEAFTNSAGQSFVLAAGNEGSQNGISLWSLSNAGQLTFQNARGDDQNGAGEHDAQGNSLSRDLISTAWSQTGLCDSAAAVFAEIGGKTYVFVGGNEDDITIFRIDADARGDGTFDLTLVGQIDDCVCDISSLVFIPSGNSGTLVVGGEQSELRYASVIIDATGVVTLDIAGHKIVDDAWDPGAELQDSEDMAYVDGVLVSASNNDHGVAVMTAKQTVLTAAVTTVAGQGNDFVNAGTGDDTAYGGDGNDSMLGGDGNDILFGDAGNDTLDGGFGNDSLNAGDGNDFVTDETVGNVTGGGADTISLGAGNDSFVGWGQNVADTDMVYGGAGDDNINLRQSFDTVFGGDGNDLIRTNDEDATYGDLLSGDAGNDTIYGANTNDTLFGGADQDALYGGGNNDSLSGDAGNDALFGGTGNDSLTGGDGNDYMRGDNGNDTLIGGIGDDDTYGDDGDDSLVGGDGNDFMLGGVGNDTMSGDAGNDAMYGGYGDDSVSGGDGNDYLSGEFGNDTLDGGAGNDLIYGGSEDDSVSGGLGADSLFGDAGNDTIFNGAGSDLVYGGDGDDLLDDASGFNSTSDADTVYGDGGNDTIWGSSAGDLLYGGADNDQLGGDGGNDTLYGGLGNDNQMGDAGDDRFVLTGVFGNDTLVGGENLETLGDTVDASSQSADITLTFTGSETGTISAGTSNANFIQMESFLLGSGNDLVNGGVGNDRVDGGAGNDTFMGGVGNDTLSGGDGADLFVHNLATTTNDRYDGGAGSDTLHINVTAAEWANPVFQTDVAGFLAHIASGSAADFVFASTGLTVRSIENFSINIDGVPTDPRDAGLTLANDTVSFTEDGPAVAVNLLANDIIEDRAGAVQILGSSAYGALSLTNTLLTTPQTAVLTFTPNANVQALRAGQIVSEVITYQVTDVDGDVQTASVTLTLMGTNDAATITGLSTGNLIEDVVNSVSGSLTVTDVDTGEAEFQVPTSLVGTYGSFGFNAATGAWSYAVNNALVQSLAVGQQVQDSLTVTSLDGTASRVINVTVTGTNDVPTVTALTAAVTEDVAATTLNLLAGAADVDNGAILSVANVAGLVAGVSLSGSTLTVDPANAAFQSLAVGEVRTITVSYDVQDQQGASVAQTATITVTGTNDTPTVAAALTALVTEDAAATSLNLLAGAADVDNGAILSVANVAGLVAGVSLSGSTLSVDPSNAAFQSLAVGEQRTITISYDVQDQQGATVAQTATITVTGTNDTPTVAAALTALVTEDAAATTLNLLAGAADVDNGAILSVDNVAGLVAGVSLSGSTLSVDPANVAFQSLALGQTRTITVSYDVQDQHGATVAQTATITVTGTNDTPTVAAALTSATTDGSAAYSINLLAGAADVDNGAVLSVANLMGLVAGLTLVDNSLSVDPSQFKFLADGETQTFTLTYDVRDGEGASVAQTTTLTVTGANDAPTVAATTVITNEDISQVVVHLDQIADDVDSDDDGTTLTYAITSGPDVGTATINGTTLTYVAGPEFQYLAQGETRDVTVQLTATDSNGATGVNNVTLTVQGVNDAPEFAPPIAPYVTLDGNDGLVTPNTLEFQTDQVTYEGWFKWDGTATGGNEVLFYNGVTASEGFGVAGNVVNGALNLQVLVGGVATLATSATLDAGTWYHVALTRDGNFNLYLNGQSVTVGNNAVTPIDSTGFGRFAVGTDPAGGSLFSGSVAEVRIWTAALDQAAITDGLSRAVTGSEPNLAAGWSMNGGPVNIFFDPNFGDQLSVQGNPVFQTGDLGGWPFENLSLRGFIADFQGDGSDGASDFSTSTSKTLAFTDVDLSDTHTVEIMPTGAGYLGTMSASIDSDSMGLGSLSWSFNVANAALDFLAQGENLTQTYTLALTDAAAGVVTETVTNTILGSNDAAVAEDLAVEVVQDDVITGQLTAIDADAAPGDVPTFDLTSFPMGLTLNTDGSYTFDASAYGPVAIGETQEVVATYFVTDALGLASVERTMTFTIVNPADVGMRLMADAFVFNAPTDGGPDLTLIQNPNTDPVGFGDDTFVWQDPMPLLDLTTGDAII